MAVRLTEYTDFLVALALPVGLVKIAEELNALGVRCYNFRLDRADMAGYETFHAKVVLVDPLAAYVGSANMNRWPFEYSLELGLRVTGKAGVRIAEIVDAVIHVSAPIYIHTLSKHYGAET